LKQLLLLLGYKLYYLVTTFLFHIIHNFFL